MPLILVTNTYNGRVLEIVKENVPEGFEIQLLQENTKESLLSCVKEADYILASGRVKIDAEVLDKAIHLKMIQRTGVGLDSLSLEALKERNIPLYVNQGVNSESVAEHTILLMLACLRRLTVIDHNTKNGIWNKQAQGIQTRELGRQTVGIFGMGNIGQKVARLLNAFGTKMLYYSTSRQSAQREEVLGIKYVKSDVLFEQADILTLHCPLTSDTTEIINEDTLARMKDGAILVNTARGGLVNEQAVVEALHSGKLAFAGLDVFSSEPVKNLELLACKNLITTPHIAGVTYDSFSQMMHDAMRNIKLFEEGKLRDIENKRLNL